MKISINRETGLATRMVNDVAPFEVASEEYIIHVDPPEVWVECGYVWADGEWEVYDQSVIDAELQRINGIERMGLKSKRSNYMQSAVVTTTSNRVFDADEDSQNRMIRSISSMEDGELMQWVLADNTVAPVSREELQEALRLAVRQQSDHWQLSSDLEKNTG